MSVAQETQEVKEKIKDFYDNVQDFFQDNKINNLKN